MRDVGYLYGPGVVRQEEGFAGDEGGAEGLLPQAPLHLLFIPGIAGMVISNPSNSYFL
jgi:hypothetical protein